MVIFQPYAHLLIWPSGLGLMYQPGANQLRILMLHTYYYYQIYAPWQSIITYRYYDTVTTCLPVPVLNHNIQTKTDSGLRKQLSIPEKKCYI